MVRVRPVLPGVRRVLPEVRRGSEGASKGSSRAEAACDGGGEVSDLASVVPGFGDARLPPRFWRRVAPCPVTGCWLWSAWRTHSGYGSYSEGSVKIVAHRAAYTAFVGAIPRGLELDHLCRVRGCCNPWHVEAVTHRVNMQRAERRGPNNFYLSKTHCPRGHAYSGDNLRVSKRGWRTCRACDLVRTRKYELTRVRDRRVKR